MSSALQIQLSNLAFQSLALFLTGIAVYVITRLLKLRSSGWAFPDARRAAIPALVLVAAWILLLIAVVVWFTGRAPVSSSVPSRPHYDLGRLLNQAIVYLIFVGPALLFMRFQREPWASAGVSRRNLPGALLVGGVLAAVSIATSGGIQALLALDADQLWALPTFAVVGFGEEFLFRGYLQTRLIAWLGQWSGWLLSSFIMAMMHVGQRVAIQGLSSPEAIVSSALLIPISLFMGYVMIRTGNIVAPGICHMFADWVGVLS